MTAPTRPTYTTLNDLVLRYQDEAYTLAYYFLGQEQAAMEATQSAFQKVYRPDIVVEHFRLEALRQVLQQCRGKRPPIETCKSDPVCERLHRLPEEEQAAIILIDVLGLSYEQAAYALSRNQQQVGKLVSQARRELNLPGD